MRIEFLINDLEPRLSRLMITLSDDPQDLLRVKRLPRAWYDHIQDKWIVPITIKLAEALEKSEALLGVALLALVQEQEAVLLADITAPAQRMTISDMYKIDAAEAVRKAYENHWAVGHKGNDQDFIKNHAEILKEEAPQSKPKRNIKVKTEQETTRKLLKQGRKD